MKKQILFLGTVALMLTSCGGSGKSAANEAGSVAADTVAEASAVSAADELITPDLIYAQVKGPVRSVSTNDFADKIEFNENGMIVKIENYSDFSPRTAKRDADGRLISWSYETASLTWENGLPKTFIVSENEVNNTYTYTYDADGRLVKEEILYEFAGEEPSTETVTYTYGADSFDSHGNWIKRTTSRNGETTELKRTIEYYK